MANNLRHSRKMSAGTLYCISDFKIIRQIGEGAYASVFLVEWANDKKAIDDCDMIMKRVLKAKSQPYFIYAEKEAGRRLNHPNIVKTIASFEDGEYFYLIQSFVAGKDLYKFFEDRHFGALSEERAKNLFRQLASGINYSNRSAVAHRDLKLENVIISDTESPKEKLTVIDFGLCGIDADSLKSEHWVGSPDYVAPEILLHEEYTSEKADTWSLGVLLFIFLTGKLPFHKKKRYSMLRMKQHPTLQFPSDVSISEEAKHLVNQMLQFQPQQRYTLTDVVNHPWLKL